MTETKPHVEDWEKTLRIARWFGIEWYKEFLQEAPEILEGDLEDKLRTNAMLTGAGNRILLLRDILFKSYDTDLTAVLKESGKGIVSQSEHTILVTEKGCDILTKA